LLLLSSVPFMAPPGCLGVIEAVLQGRQSLLRALLLDALFSDGFGQSLLICRAASFA
jgi:hypothetical protein